MRGARDGKDGPIQPRAAASGRVVAGGTPWACRFSIQEPDDTGGILDSAVREQPTARRFKRASPGFIQRTEGLPGNSRLSAVRDRPGGGVRTARCQRHERRSSTQDNMPTDALLTTQGASLNTKPSDPPVSLQIPRSTLFGSVWAEQSVQVESTGINSFFSLLHAGSTARLARPYQHRLQPFHEPATPWLSLGSY